MTCKIFIKRKLLLSFEDGKVYNVDMKNLAWTDKLYKISWDETIHNYQNGGNMYEKKKNRT